MEDTIVKSAVVSGFTLFFSLFFWVLSLWVGIFWSWWLVMILFLGIWVLLDY